MGRGLGSLAVAVSLSGAFFLQLAQPSVAADDVISSGALKAEMHLPLHKAIGSKKAGLFCLPDGKFTLGDFLPNEAYLKALIVGAIQETGRTHLQEEVSLVVLKKMNVSLCARDFLFDRRKYTGKVYSEFEVTFAQNRSVTRVIEFAVTKEEPQSEVEITQKIAKELAVYLLGLQGA